MALLTAAEKKQLAEQGYHGAKEKCDNCGKPLAGLEYIGPVRGIPKGQKWCENCVTGQRMTEVPIQEEKRMRKEKTEKAGKEKTSKVAGHLVAGTAIADIYLYLQDEKVHKIADVKKGPLAKHKADPMGRMQQLGRYGKKFGAWAVTIDTEAGTIQMKLGKGAAKVSTPAKEKEEPAVKKGKKVSSKKAAEEEPEEPEEEQEETTEEEEVEEEVQEKPSKQQSAVQKLVRRTLKSGKDWTKNKLIEYLNKEHKIDPKRTEMAITEELKAKGIELDDGVLTLA